MAKMVGDVSINSFDASVIYVLTGNLLSDNSVFVI